jgi:hypothetical protein
MSKSLTFGATTLFACILSAIPVSLRISPDARLSLSANSASAEIGRPLTATSVAGVHRRHARRAYRRGYYGYGENYQPYRYGSGYGFGTGMYQTYNNFGYRPWSGTGFGWNQPSSGYASTGYRYVQQPYGGYYGGYGQRHWTEF